MAPTQSASVEIFQMNRLRINTPSHLPRPPLHKRVQCAYLSLSHSHSISIALQTSIVWFSFFVFVLVSFAFNNFCFNCSWTAPLFIHYTKWHVIITRESLIDAMFSVSLDIPMDLTTDYSTGSQSWMFYEVAILFLFVFVSLIAAGKTETKRKRKRRKEVLLISHA